LSALPAVAPRGKHFAVISMSHVAGGSRAPHFVMSLRLHSTLADAQAEAARIDWRLSPSVAIVATEPV
jgi:hypothetical protein